MIMHVDERTRPLSELLEESTVGPILKMLRVRSGLNQRDLAKSAGMSQRHISFVETGRAIPSRSAILKLGSALSVEPSLVNSMLEACGYAAHYQEENLERAISVPSSSAIRFALNNHDPLPAVLNDDKGRTLMLNEGGRRLMLLFTGKRIMDEDLPISVAHRLFMDDENYRVFVDSQEMIVAYIKSLRVEDTDGETDLDTLALVEQLRGMLDQRGELLLSSTDVNPLPSYRAALRVRDKLSEWSVTWLQFGSEMDPLHQGLTLQLWMPSDTTSIKHAREVFGL